MTTTELAAASDVSYPLCSFLPFQTASQTCGLGFIANLRQPLSLGCAEPAPLEGEPRSAHRRKYSEVGNNLSVSLWAFIRKDTL